MSTRINGRGRPQELRGKRKSDPRARSTSAQPSRTAPGAQTFLRGQARQGNDGVSGRPRPSSTRSRPARPETRANPATPATGRQQPRPDADPHARTHAPEIFTPSRRPERHQRLSCTWRGRAMYPGRFSAGFWPRPAAARARRLAVGLRGRSPSCTARACGPGHLRLGPRCGSGSCRGYGAGGPDPAEGGPAAGAVCSRGTAARRMCRGAGDGSTGTGKTWQRGGTGSPGMSPVSARLTRVRGGRPGADAGGLRPGCWSGDGPRSGQTVRPDSRTGAHSAPLANTGTNTYSA